MELKLDRGASGGGCTFRKYPDMGSGNTGFPVGAVFNDMVAKVCSTTQSAVSIDTICLDISLTMTNPRYLTMITMERK